MSSRVRGYVRQNHLALLALGVAVVGVPTAWAVGKNTVGSKQLKPSAVRNADLADDAVTSAKIADGEVRGEDVAEDTLGPVPRADRAEQADTATTADRATSAATATNATSAQNADTLDGQNSTAFVGTSTEAAGDLGGPFSSLQIAPGAVGSSEVANGALTGDDINESTLSLAGVMAGRITNVGGAGTAELGAPSGVSVGATSIGDTESMIMPVGTRVSSLIVRNDVSIPAGRSRTVTLVNGINLTTLSCTITGNQQQCTNAGSVNVGGNPIAIQVESTGAGIDANDDVSFGFRISN